MAGVVTLYRLGNPPATSARHIVLASSRRHAERSAAHVDCRYASRPALDRALPGEPGAGRPPDLPATPAIDPAWPPAGRGAAAVDAPTGKRSRRLTQYR